ncbi:energy transducer TonB [Luteolibacter flavescens]|uniref:Energy transducer TonB n=1 Tax=Luteolibacter flavescens TaxID=1859460 RepID=A0ABT3FP03_9BACT|nr:energy transducer TonB [Luteolibacter flavescens]MCW1885300.1 energy transducer TonB [Luteolibacter flavescens]
MNLARTLFLSAATALTFAGCAAGPDPSIDPNQKSFFVDVEYTIGTDGKTKDAKVISSDAPKQLQKEALNEVKKYRADPSVDPSRARRRIEYNVG